MITALVLTPFVSGPDRSFVGSLLATSAPEQIVAVNRTLKGDRRATNSMLAEHATPQSIMPKSTSSASSSAPPASEQTRSSETPAVQQRLLDGCESAFSEITDRQLANIPGRCMAALPGRPLQVATLN
jgi:hypothetical protein